jgi:hypothetical protein
MPVGWPTDADLAAKLGPHVDPTDPLVTSANEAAAADAIRYGTASGAIDATAGAVTAAGFEDVLALGVWRYQDRNKGPEWAAQGEYGPNAADRLRILGRLQGGLGLPVA